MKGGNSFIYCIFIILNLLIIAIGLAILGATVYLWTITKKANYWNCAFLGLGTFIILIAT